MGKKNKRNKNKTVQNNVENIQQMQQPKSTYDPALQEREVQELLQLADNIYNYGKYGTYTPETLHQNLVNLNNSPVTPTYEQVINSLKNYNNDSKSLQSFNEAIEQYDMLFKRVIEYYSNMLSFDMFPVCQSAAVMSKEDFKKKEYLDDKESIRKFFNGFDYKAEFKKMLKEMLRHETAFTWFRVNDRDKDNPKYTLQIMPQDRCKITGLFNSSGFLYDFDMNYFTQAGVDIDGYAPAFKQKYWKRTFGDGINQGFDNYIPTNPLNKRNGSFSLWTQTSPEDGAWCFKFDTSNFSSAPFLSGLLKDMIKNADIQKLQNDKDMASAYAMLIGEIGLYEKAQSGQEYDQWRINPKTLGALLRLVKNGLERNIKVGAMPTEEVEFYQFEDKNPNMYINQIKTSTAIGAAGSRAIANGDKVSNFELENSLITDYEVVRKTYAQFNHFLNYFANQVTKKYKFNFVCDGCVYPFEREYRKDTLQKHLDLGITPDVYFLASVYGYNPFDFEASVATGANDGFISEHLLLLQSVHTASGKEENKGATEEGGRQEKTNKDISETGENNRNTEPPSF